MQSMILTPINGKDVVEDGLKLLFQKEFEFSYIQISTLDQIDA